MTVPHHHREGEPCRDVEDCRLIDPRVQILLDREAAALADRFDGIFSAETVTAVVHNSFDQLAATASIHTHLPVPAARFAHQRLDATAKNEGVTMSDMPEVLFADSINPAVVAAMDELGLDLSQPDGRDRELFPQLLPSSIVDRRWRCFGARP